MDDLNWSRLIYLLLVLMLIAPTALAMNRGHALPRIALWLGILTAIALIYQTFGPF